MADKRYQVFVSSTLLDLRDERQRVLRVLLELDCIPAGMELFPASDEERWSLIKRVIDDCDYYIVIVGGRYGSVDSEGISYTEREYDYAVATGKPVLGFVHGNPEQIEYGKSEKDDLAREKLSTFRKKVQQLVCREWTSGEGLAAAITTSLHQEIVRKPGIGWIRGDAAVPPEVRAELAELREQVSKTSATGASAESLPDESLQQGEDKFSVAVQLTGGVAGLQNAGFSRAWNELFRMVGPLVRDKTSDHLVHSGFERAVAEEMGRSSAFTTVVSSSYNQVMLQFEALGMIEYIESGIHRLRAIGADVRCAGKR